VNFTVKDFRRPSPIPLLGYDPPKIGVVPDLDAWTLDLDGRLVGPFVVDVRFDEKRDRHYIPVDETRYWYYQEDQGGFYQWGYYLKFVRRDTPVRLIYGRSPT